MQNNLINYEEEFKSGKYLFKFCKFNVFTIQTLVNKTLYFSSPDKLNDPLDCRFKLKIKNPNNFSNKTQEIIKYSGWFLNEELDFFLNKDANLRIGDEKRQVEFLHKFLTYVQNSYIGICSFSTVFSNNLLWSHYSDEARGLCLVFDKQKLIESIKENSKNLNVKITPKRISYGGIKNIEIQLYKNGNLGYSIEHLFSKTKQWNYEKEFRIIVEQKPNHSLFSPINKLNPFIDFSEESLSYIVLGERIFDSNRSIIVNLKEERLVKSEILEHKFDY